jgi:hypothetical protein
MVAATATTDSNGQAALKTTEVLGGTSGIFVIWCYDCVPLRELSVAVSAEDFAMERIVRAPGDFSATDGRQAPRVLHERVALRPREDAVEHSPPDGSDAAGDSESHEER